jgi:acyl-coenzyme A thioesterase PaaI-like protein
VAFISQATGRLTATGRATGGGRSVCFCEADIADAEGHLVARAMGTFRYRDPT